MHDARESGNHAAPATPYTLTPWPQSVDQRLARYEAAFSWLTTELAAIAELVHLRTGPVDVALEVDALRDKVEYLTRRVEALEADGRTYRAALDAQGDALQLLTLRGKP